MKHPPDSMGDDGWRPIVKDAVNHPPHYAELQPEPIDVIEGWRLPFHLGNTIKYISRAGRKTADALTDLKKSRWYLDRYIEQLELGAKVEAEPKPACSMCDGKGQYYRGPFHYWCLCKVKK